MARTFTFSANGLSGVNAQPVERSNPNDVAVVRGNSIECHAGPEQSVAQAPATPSSSFTPPDIA